MLNTSIQLNGKIIGKGHRPYLVAEMACAHDGDYEKAIRIADAAIEARADAVQLQFFRTEQIVVPHHKLFKTLKGIEFSPDQWKALAEHCRERGVEVLACTYDVPSVQLAKDIDADGLKINSADLSNPDVLQAAASSGLPITLGTGASTLTEISEGLEVLERYGARNIVLMHGVQNFPTRIADLNIARVSLLSNTYDIPVGYHDHTDGADPFSRIVDLIAVGAGAQVIEKHITFDRKQEGLDYQAALEPDEFGLFAELLRTGWKALGTKWPKPFSESDLAYRKFQKKTIVAARTLPEGTTIGREDVVFLRAVENGLPPKDFPRLLSGKTRRAISPFENITLDDVE